MNVEIFNVTADIKALDDCPKIVKDYVDLLEKSRDRWKDIAGGAVSKLKSTFGKYIVFTEGIDPFITDYLPGGPFSPGTMIVDISARKFAVLLDPETFGPQWQDMKEDHL